MIFTPISKSINRTELIEKISIYIRIVSIIAQNNNLTISDITEENLENVVIELIDMGVIKSKTDLPLLEKTLSKQYKSFLNSIAFYITNKPLFDDTLHKLNNKKRKDLQQKTLQSKAPTLVDFFAGAGGLSLGFYQAGFRTCLANDFEEVCVRTYRYNHPELQSDKVICCDIKELIHHLPNYRLGDIDVVVGGPPCQGFSSANQQRIIDDPRNELYKYFIKAVEILHPSFVVMENVKGMLKVAEQVVEDFSNVKITREGKKYSYIVSYQLLNAVDFCVAQNRERLIYIAIREDVAIKQNITPEKIFEQIKKETIKNKQFFLSDALEAIKPLEASREKNQNEVDSEISGKKIDNNYYFGNENSYLKTINEGRNIPFVFNHKARFVNDINYDIYQTLEQGDDASDPKIADIMPYTHRLHCFKDKYYKLIANRPSRTITAHLRMDCHSHIHPYQIRAITPREAARIQSFPDDYLFLGPYLKTYMQIGNAVPCLMSKTIASIIKQYIK